MATTAGDPKDLYQHLQEARIAGEGRSSLAGPFEKLEAVDVAAHEQSEPSPASFITDNSARMSYWPQVQMRYSRLVEPVAPGELVDFVRRLRSLSGHPSFVRLNRTKQLGTTSLAGNIGASHSRLEHSLGVLDIALLLCDKLSIFFDERQEQWGGSRDTILRSIALLAFIHDAFHGPYGHTMDPIRYLIDPNCRSDRLDKAALNAEISRARQKTGWLWDALLLVYESNKELLHTDIDYVYQMIVLRDEDLNFAREIIDGAVDADRLDYIPRDQSHLFLGDTISVQDLVDKARFFPDEKGRPQLHFAQQSDTKIWRLLEQRIFLYDHIYEAAPKVPYDEMIVHAVLLLFEDFRCGTQVFPGGTEYEYRVKIAGEFSRLSDIDLHRMFDLLPSTPRIVLGRLLLEDVRANAPFVLLADEPIPSRGMAAMRLRLNEHEATILRVLGSLSDGEREALHAEAGEGDPLLRGIRQSVLQKIAEATRGSVGYETFDEFEFKVLSEYAEEVEPFDKGGGKLTLGEIDEEHLYWMCFYLSDNLPLRKNFEFKLWRRFRQEWSGFDSWRGRLVGEIEKRMIEDERVPTGAQRGDGEGADNGEFIKALRKECRQVVDDTPLLFVAATKIPPTIRDVVLRNRVREAPIRFYNERRERHVAAEPIERYGPPSYHIRLAAPASLGESARLELQRIWKEEVESWGWIDPRLVREGGT